MELLLAWLAANWIYVVAVAGVVAFLGRGVQRIWPLVKKFVHLIDDLAGEPARDGVPARPGVMARLSELEGRTKELRNNGGSTIKDAVDRIDQRTELLEQRMDALERVAAPDQPDIHRRRRRWY